MNGKICFSDPGGAGSIQRADTDGSNLEVVLTGLGIDLRAIVLDPDEKTVYFTTGAGTIQMVAFDGTGPFDVVTGLSESTGIALYAPLDYTSRLPDLAVNSVTPLVTCNSDGDLSGTVTVNVSNDGCGDAANVVVRLTSDCGISFTDQSVDLNQGTSQDVIFNYTPDCTTPTCIFTAEIDPDSAICECSSAAHIAASAPYTMDIPDIEVQSDTLAVTCSDDGQVTTSGNVTLINNGQGSNLTTDIPMRFTIYDNTGCGGNQISQWTETFTGTVIASAGGTQTFTIQDHDITANLCTNSTNCRISIFVEADYNNSICEWDGTDNTACSDNLTVDIPDLQITGNNLGYVCNGDGIGDFTGDLTLSNNGCGSLAATDIPVRFSLYNGPNGTGTLLGQYTETFSSLSIASGNSQTVTVSHYNLVQDLCSISTNCQLSVLAEADPGAQICECYGANNQLVQDFALHMPILAVEEVIPEMVCGYGEKLQGGVNVTVANTGCGDATDVVVRLTDDCDIIFQDQTVNIPAGERLTLVFYGEGQCWSEECIFEAEVDPDGAICECNGLSHALASDPFKLPPVVPIPSTDMVGKILLFLSLAGLGLLMIRRKVRS